MRRKSTTRQYKAATESSGPEPDATTYRPLIACMARALVADMFAHHQTCALRDCRAAGSCQACCEGGFCPVEMDSCQALVFVGMMAFHDVLSSEALGCEPVEAS